MSITYINATNEQIPPDLTKLLNDYFTKRNLTPGWTSQFIQNTDMHYTYYMFSVEYWTKEQAEENECDIQLIQGRCNSLSRDFEITPLESPYH